MYYQPFKGYKTNEFIKPGSLADAAQKILMGESTELEEGVKIHSSLIKKYILKAKPGQTISIPGGEEYTKLDPWQGKDGGWQATDGTDLENNELINTLEAQDEMLDWDPGDISENTIKEDDDMRDRQLKAKLDTFGETMDDLIKKYRKPDPALSYIFATANEMLSSDKYRPAFIERIEDGFYDFYDESTIKEFDDEFDEIADRASEANQNLMTLLDKAEDNTNDPDLKLAIQIAMDNLDQDRFHEELFDAIETSGSRRVE